MAQMTFRGPPSSWGLESESGMRTRTAGVESLAIITNASSGIYIPVVHNWPNCFTSPSLALLICKAETKMPVVPSWLKD